MYHELDNYCTDKPMLTLENMQASRTQAELAKWFDVTVEGFGKSQDGKNALRLHNGGLEKRLVEELQPMRWYADAFHKGDENAYFVAQIEPQESYDAIVRDSDDKIMFYLQITLAFEGYQSRLRMEHLAKYGRAPLTGVTFEKGKDGNIPEMWPEAENLEDRNLAEFEQILAVFENKAEKRYETNTKLVIAFHSNGIIDGNYIRSLDAFVRSHILIIFHTYKEIIFVSGIDGLYLQYACNDN